MIGRVVVARETKHPNNEPAMATIGSQSCSRPGNKAPEQCPTFHVPRPHGCSRPGNKAPEQLADLGTYAEIVVAARETKHLTARPGSAEWVEVGVVARPGNKAPEQPSAAIGCRISPCIELAAKFPENLPPPKPLFQILQLLV